MAKLETHDRSQAVELPENVHWPDEFGGWQPIEKSSKRSAAGGLITQGHALIGGRPIPLLDFWLSREAVAQLYEWAGTLGEFYLTLPDGREFTVMFADAAPLTAAPVFEAAAPDPATPYHVSKLEFKTV